MEPNDPRWVEVTPSQFTHEAEGLRVVRELLPSIGPYRAWSNFEFRDAHGKWHEVDLLVLGRRRMHLVELKYYSGTLTGDDHRWWRDQRDTEDSPLKLARRKAQRLASKLQDSLRDLAREKPGLKIPDVHDVVPFVQEAVYLHHPSLRCGLPATCRLDLFGLDGHERDMGLPGISQRLLEAPTDRHAVPPRRDELITKLMQRIGIVARRQREVGSWIIDEEPLAEGEGWQDWPAFHRVATTDRARIRFFVTAPGSAAEQRTRMRRIAEHEFQVMRRLAHDGVARPLDVVDAELGIGLVYPHDQRYRRLDLWLADHRGGVPVATQLAVLRQVAEAVGYAHRHRVVHRGLTPQAVSVRGTVDGRLRVLVGDWQTAGSLPNGQDSSAPPSVVTLLGAGYSTDAAERLTSIMAGRHPDADRQLAAAFHPPEGAWQRDTDRVRLDVYALGALAYYLLTGRPPAVDRSELRERLRRDDGLDLAADLPQVPSEVRDLVLESTRPAVRDRLADVTAFLKRLDDAERALVGPDELAPKDILEVKPGTVVEGRYRVERRLGAGSTAVGLQVIDLQADGVTRVLKVARDDAAAGRLADEAEVLRLLDHPRLIRLIDGPEQIGNRTVLVLEHAGDATLSDVLADRARQSIDLLERWGTDLLEALVELDRVGITHRDIKPANLGVAEARKDRAKHLVLFDFSLSRAGAGALTAGTPPYLDPFLDAPGRRQYDTAAERYAAAVVLFEMATGVTPVYGDGLSDPSVVGVEATIALTMFDPAVAAQMTAFFRRALHPEAACRFNTAAELLAAWRAIFAPVPSTVPEGADDVTKRATLDTALARSGLSPRALSALDPLALTTVADLLAVDPVRLNHLSGVADATRREIKQRARDWRARLGERERRAQRHPAQDTIGAAEQLRDAAGSPRARARRGAAALLLGLEGNLDAFATQAEVAETLGVSRPRGNQYIEMLQDAWADDPASRELLDALGGLALDALSGLGGVATVRELAGELLAVLGGTSDELRVAAGLLRVALDRADALRRAEAQDAPLARRRRGGRLELLAVDPALLDVADALSRRATELVDAARQAGETLVPAARTNRELGDVLRQALDGHGMAVSRVAQLAAALSPRAALSGRGELHDVDMPLVDALRLTLGGIGITQRLTPHEVRSRVRARFPALPPLPTDRHRLDVLVRDACLDLTYDRTVGAYQPPTRLGDTNELGTRQSSQLPWMPANSVVEGGHAAARLAESARTRSFLALGIDADYAGKAVEMLTARHGVERVDATRVLVEAMREQARVVGLPWETVRAADAAAPATLLAFPRSCSARCPPSTPRSSGRWRAQGREAVRYCWSRRRRWPGMATSERWPAGPISRSVARRRCGCSCRNLPGPGGRWWTAGRCRWRPRASSCAWTLSGSARRRKERIRDA